MTAILRRRRRKILASLVLFAIIGAALAYSQLSPIGELMPEAIAALRSDDIIHVNRERWIVFAPNAAEVASGFIFYPGGRVQPEAYAPLARAIAENGHLAVIVPMPLNLAIFNPNAANEVIAAYPGSKTWVIGGHSLGGVMAARYAFNHGEKIDGLALLAAYAETHVDLSRSDLRVTTIYGDRDGLVAVADVARSLDQLPAGVYAVQVEGGNHAQFGWYGEQSGDLPARISRDEQNAQVVDAVLRIMQQAGN